MSINPITNKTIRPLNDEMEMSLMNEFDDAAVKKMEDLLGVVGETENFGAVSDELSVDELDMVTGGVTMPNFQQFMQYVRDRDTRENP